MKSRVPSARTFVRLTATLFATLAGLLLPRAAMAVPVTYRWVGTISGGGYGTTPIPDSGEMFLTVTDAAVAAGSMQFTVNAPAQFGYGGSCPGFGVGDCVITGDPTGYLSFGRLFPDFTGDGVTSGISGQGWFSLGLSFNPDGTLTGGIIDHGTNSDIIVGGSKFNWSGTLFSDAAQCGSFPGPGCTVSGYFLRTDVAIPEPPSIWIFLSGLAALAGVSGALRWKLSLKRAAP